MRYPVMTSLLIAGCRLVYGQTSSEFEVASVKQLDQTVQPGRPDLTFVGTSGKPFHIEGHRVSVKGTLHALIADAYGVKEYQVSAAPQWAVYSENGAFATTSAKLGDVYPSTYRTPKSRTMLSKVVAGFRRTMLQRQSLSPFFSARRGNSARIAPCLSCGIRSRPAPRTSTVIPEWVIATSGSL